MAKEKELKQFTWKCKENGEIVRKHITSTSFEKAYTKICDLSKAKDFCVLEYEGWVAL